MTKSKKHKTPRECRSLHELADIPFDNRSSGDFSILTDGYTVSLTEQKLGEKPKQSIDMPRVTFNRLIDWYQTGTMRPRKAKR